MTLRVLFCSDHPGANSGYAVQTALAARHLKKHCDLALLATFGLHGSIGEWEGIPLFPGGADAYANDVIGKAAKAWQADVVITLKDTLVFNPQFFQGLRWLPMAPIDHDPPSPVVIERCRASYRPIAYAPQGFRALRAAGLDPLYAPHAYDPAVFNPQPKEEARRALGIDPSLFIVGTVAVNRGGLPSRKLWPENLQAFAKFAADKPDVRYFLHTDMADDSFEGGVPLRPLAAQLGILEKVIFCDQERYRIPHTGGFPQQYMNAFYNSIDVLNAVSLGEGFGIPALESQACGTPVIVGDWCAHEDLCFGGWKVEKSEAHHAYNYDNQQGWTYIARPDAIADRMEEAHNAILYGESDRAELSAHAIAGSLPYQIETVVRDHWLSLLSELERDIRSIHSRGVLRIVRPEELNLA